MEIFVNGQAQKTKENALLVDILASEGVSLQTKGIAVAINEEVSPRAEWASYILKEGDRIEIVQARQGG